jgi:hypothetical protein
VVPGVGFATGREWGVSFCSPPPLGPYLRCRDCDPESRSAAESANIQTHATRVLELREPSACVHRSEAVVPMSAI